MRLLNNFFGHFAKDIGVDLGTVNTLVYVKGRGIVINEPSLVAVNKKTGQILAIGREARKMVGRTPGHIAAVKPLVDGVISDFDITEQMLKYFFQKVHGDSFYMVPRPRVVIGIPSGVTEVEKKAVEEAARNAGAREVMLIEEPVAAALGARLPVQEALGNMIVDIGGGTTEVAVISLGGLVAVRSLRVAGERLNEDIIQLARDEYNLLLGPRTAEDVKIAVAAVVDLNEKLETTMRGRDLITGLPKEVVVTSKEVKRAITKSVKTLVDVVREIVEQTPPELLSDIMKRGIVLAGGGSLLRGIDELINKETGIAVKVAEDPLTAVARGTGIVLEETEKYRELLAVKEYTTTPKE
ncbi:MAG: rod shape-determining protein [Candidatus Sungbacteria bacterium]|uniref:Cell shape-determining protein MreB n=2 Tax=Candidatus Sungiibacteriota bacterium TaxID=2750080 RepID=A0A9D6DQK2_9BACT|nr:rod shape-determining protein [Candidatus Sungbacteria bacterium]